MRYRGMTARRRGVSSGVRQWGRTGFDRVMSVPLLHAELGRLVKRLTNVTANNNFALAA